MQNEKFTKELNKKIIRKFEKMKIQSSFTDNIWGADHAYMQLISKFNKGFIFLLYVIDIFSKYACVIPLKEKRGTIITNAFQRISNELGWKPKKNWSDDIVKRCNNSYHSTTKLKPFDVKSSTDIDSSKENNEKYPKFKIGDIFRISKYKNIFTIFDRSYWQRNFGDLLRKRIAKKIINNK